MFIVKRMAANPVTAAPVMQIAEARRLMKEHKIRHLPVVDEQGKLLGIVSDRDLRDAMPSVLTKDSEGYSETMDALMSSPVSEIMTKNPVSIYVFNTIQDALVMMGKHKFGALPVVDENGFLKGVLSTRDLLRAFVDVMGLDEPGTLLCILSEDKQGQMKKIVDIIAEEKISLGSVLVSKTLEENKKAIFPYLLTYNVATVKKRLMDIGFEMLDPMQWYHEQFPGEDR